jgi:PST family polysaccharide transporter
VDEGGEAPASVEKLLESGADLAAEGDLPDRPPDLTRKAAGGFVWALLGFMFVQGGSFATYTVASRILGARQIGLVGTLLTVVFWIDIFLDTGLGASVIYEQERGQTHRIKVAFTLTTAMSLVATLAVFFGAPLIAGYYRASGDVDLFRLLALVVAAKGLNQVPSAMLRRDMDFRKPMVTNLFQSLARFGIAVWLVEAGHGVVGMLIGIIVAETSSTALTWMWVRFRPAFRFDRKVAAEMFRYGLPVFGATLLGMLWLNGDYLVVGRKFGGDSAQYGNYYTAFRLPELVLGSFYNIFSNIAFPMYSAARKAGVETLRSASLRSLRLLCLVGFTAGVGMSLVADDFIATFYGSGFAGAIRPMEILCVAGGFVGVGFASGDLYNAIGRQKLGLVFNLIGTPVLITGFIIAASHGIEAIAYVHLAVMVPYSFVRIGVANRLIGTTWPQSFDSLASAAAAVTGMLLFALPVRLLLDQGPLRMLTIVVAGVLGAAVGVAIGARKTYPELQGLVVKALGR